MWLSWHASWCKVERSTTAELAWLSAYLSFSNSKARFTGGRSSTSALDSRRKVFMAGFLPWVLQAAKQDGVEVELIDRRVKADAVPTAALPAPVERAGVDLAWDAPADQAHPFGWLHRFQVDAVRAVLRRRRGIIRIPTGGGKTELLPALANAVPGRWLFLVDSLDLAKQAAERHELRTGRRAGIIGEGVWDPQEVTCATFQTLAARLASEDAALKAAAAEVLGAADGLLVDECHTLPAATYTRVAQRCHRASWRVGLSATPLERSDQRSSLAVGVLGPVIYEVPSQRLRDLGVLSSATVYLVPCDQRVEADDWATGYRVGVEESAPRNALVVEAARLAMKPAFVFVKGIDHGRALTAALDAAGVRTAFVYGEHETDERRAAIRRLERGELDALVCSVVFNKGIDVPGLRACVNAAGGESVIATLQKIGRGMRVQKDATGRVVKDSFEVWDVLDRGCGCLERARQDPQAKPHRGCAWLARHARKRVRSYVREGHATTERELLAGPAQRRLL